MVKESSRALNGVENGVSQARAMCITRLQLEQRVGRRRNKCIVCCQLGVLMRLSSSSSIKWVECIALLSRRVLQLLVLLGLGRLFGREARCAAVGSTAQTQECRLASSPLCRQGAAWSGRTGSVVPALAVVQVETAGGLGCRCRCWCRCRCRCWVLASEVSDMRSWALMPDPASKTNPLPLPLPCKARRGPEQATGATGSCQQEKQGHSSTGLTVTDAHGGRMRRADKGWGNLRGTL